MKIYQIIDWEPSENDSYTDSNGEDGLLTLCDEKGRTSRRPYYLDYKGEDIFKSGWVTIDAYGTVHSFYDPENVLSLKKNDWIESGSCKIYTSDNRLKYRYKRRLCSSLAQLYDDSGNVLGSIQKKMLSNIWSITVQGRKYGELTPGFISVMRHRIKDYTLDNRSWEVDTNINGYTIRDGKKLVCSVEGEPVNPKKIILRNGESIGVLLYILAIAWIEEQWHYRSY